MSTRTALTAVCLCAVLAGCSSEKPPVVVTGEVTLDGAPIELGSIVFVPTNSSGQSAGGSIHNGTYRLVGPQAPTEGEYKVEIRSSQNSNRKPPGPGTKDRPTEAVAVRFNTKTELKVRIEAGGGTHNFKVLSK